MAVIRERRAMTGDAPTGRDTYCREVEAYLCRKNDGHLVRIVGPAFEQVCGWADRGVPLKAVFRGIDRYVDRYYAKGPRRRPVRVEFCEADVLDVFDEWRRAVGVAGLSEAGGAGEAGEAGGAGEAPGGSLRRRRSLPEHLDRVLARLTAARSVDARGLDAVVDEIVRELDAGRAGTKVLRGDAREAYLARLRALDAHLLESARTAADAGTRERLATEADLELAPFRSRMPRDAYDRARAACLDRLLRDLHHLPVIAMDE